MRASWASSSCHRVTPSMADPEVWMSSLHVLFYAEKVELSSKRTCSVLRKDPR